MSIHSSLLELTLVPQEQLGNPVPLQQLSSLSAKLTNLRRVMHEGGRALDECIAALELKPGEQLSETKAACVIF